MNKKELSELSDEELSKKAKKLRSESILNAFLIGFCIAIILWSVFKSSWGLVTLFPLFFIYKMINSPEKEPELKEVLRERNIK